MCFLETDHRSDPNEIFQVVDLKKQYGSSIALKGVSLSIKVGHIHGILGENGAGKSTLVGLMSGAKKPSSGRIYLNGKEILNADVRTMEEAGVFLVTQDPLIIAHLTAAENLMLGIWPSKNGFIKWNKLYWEAEKILKPTAINPRTLAGKLDPVDRRKLNILRSMYSGGKVIILDEPTTSLTIEDRKDLFHFMRKLKLKGVTFIFISHYNDEILAISDSVTVLRDGRVVASLDQIKNITSTKLAELVIGQEVSLFQRKPRSFDFDHPSFQINDLYSDHLEINQMNLYSGEIVGFTGLPNSGAKKLSRCLFGLDQVVNGSILFPEKTNRSFPISPSQALDWGIAYLSEDRRHDGFVGKMSVKKNISLSALLSISRFGVISSSSERRLVRHYLTTMKIKAKSDRSKVDTLSGGNQQKVCLSRVIATQPRLLILVEPTRGIDVGIKQEILRMIGKLADSGICIVVVSTDTDELLRLTDRVFVFKKGRIQKVFSGGEMTSERFRTIHRN